MLPRLAPALCVLFAVGCSSSGEDGPKTDGYAGPPWQPGQVLHETPAPDARGWLDLRGLIHAHSVYSHDACDNQPRDGETGPINQTCFDDFRRGMCQTEHDFIMLTDHNTSFGDTEFPDVLLYRQDLGDQLVERGGKPVANRAACPDGGHAVMILAGTESATIAAGLEEHVSTDVATRHDVYGSEQPDAISEMKAHGAVSILMHTENWTVDDITNLPVDGFEMYNLHANAITGAGGALSLVTKLQKNPEDLPQSDLVFLPIVNEDPRYIDTWGSALATGVHRVTTMATDCHRNSFPQILPDGERIDSYRRMMLWFSNHLLVKPKIRRQLGRPGSQGCAARWAALRRVRDPGLSDRLRLPRRRGRRDPRDGRQHVARRRRDAARDVADGRAPGPEGRGAGDHRQAAARAAGRLGHGERGQDGSGLEAHRSRRVSRGGADQAASSAWVPLQLRRPRGQGFRVDLLESHLRRGLTLALCLAALCASCDAQTAAGAPAECNADQFQACDAPCGRGVKFCEEESRTWSACTCIVLEAGVDAPDGAPVDASGDVAADSD